MATGIGQSFLEYVEEMNLTKMILSMMISRSISDFTSNLIDQFVDPFTDKLIKDDTLWIGKLKPKVLGTDIDVKEIINRGLNVIVSVVITFLIYQLF